MGFLSFLRLFIPSWRFFDDYGSGPLVYVRTGLDSQNLGDWILAFDPLPRTASNLFVNAKGNERLLAISNFSRLLEESQEHLNNFSALSQTVTYQIAEKIINLGLSPETPTFQFKITVRDEFHGNAKRIDAFVSNIHNKVAS